MEMLEQVLEKYTFSAGHPDVIGISEKSLCFPSIGEAMAYAVNFLAQEKEAHQSLGKNPEETWIYFKGKESSKEYLINGIGECVELR